MAVLQKQPHRIHDQGIRNIKKIYPFDKFDNQLVELDKNLKTGGLIVICFTQYRFTDSSISPRYEAYGEITQNQITPVFDKNGDIIDDSTPQLSIYRKIRNNGS